MTLLAWEYDGWPGMRMDVDEDRRGTQKPWAFFLFFDFWSIKTVGFCGRLVIKCDNRSTRKKKRGLFYVV